MPGCPLLGVAKVEWSSYMPALFLAGALSIIGSSSFQWIPMMTAKIPGNERSSPQIWMGIGRGG